MPSSRSLSDRRSHRRQSIVIDMEVPSLPPTRLPSPTRLSGIPIPEEEPMQDDGDFLARKVGLGNLMKSAKQDVSVPEFDLDLFI